MLSQAGIKPTFHQMLVGYDDNYTMLATWWLFGVHKTFSLQGITVQVFYGFYPFITLNSGRCEVCRKSCSYTVLDFEFIYTFNFICTIEGFSDFENLTEYVILF